MPSPSSSEASFILVGGEPQGHDSVTPTPSTRPKAQKSDVIYYFILFLKLRHSEFNVSIGCNTPFYGLKIHPRQRPDICARLVPPRHGWGTAHPRTTLSGRIRARVQPAWRQPRRLVQNVSRLPASNRDSEWGSSDMPNMFYALLCFAFKTSQR
jgi:hypothetical protein